MTGETLPTLRPEPPPPAAPATDGMERIAILLTALGPDFAPAVLGGLDEASLRRCAHAISKLHRVPVSRLEAVVEEFLADLDTDPGVAGGMEEARRILSNVVDTNTVARIMSDVDGHMRRSIWEQLGACADSAIARFLAAEHPQTATVVLAELSPNKAAAVLERLDEDLAQSIVLRLSRVPRLEDEVIALIEDVIVRDFLSALQQEMATRKPAEVIGGVMNNISSDARERLLKHLEERKPQLAQDVVRTMFTFADIPARVEGRDVGVVLRAVEEDVLLTALKHAETRKLPTADFILGNITRRLADRYRGELDTMQDVKQRDGEKAQQEIIAAIQRLAKAREITLVDFE
ncbi:MAG: flagellar motor switch protein FliG [Rubricella sp.]